MESILNSVRCANMRDRFGARYNNYYDRKLYNLIMDMELEDVINVCACMWSGREKMWHKREVVYTEFIDEARKICNSSESAADYICSKSKYLNDYLYNVIL